MTVRTTITLAFLCCSGATAAAAGYTPPVAPPPPDPVNVLLRLFGLTLVTLLVCGGLIWLTRKRGRALGPTNDRLVLQSTLPIPPRGSLHLLKVDTHTVAVTTDAMGIRSMVVLTEPFDELLPDA